MIVRQREGGWEGGRARQRQRKRREGGDEEEEKERERARGGDKGGGIPDILDAAYMSKFIGNRFLFEQVVCDGAGARPCG